MSMGLLRQVLREVWSRQSRHVSFIIMPIGVTISLARSFGKSVLLPAN